ncbi:hypothetical protein PZH32_02010 [Adlercreutzia equolifaciens]|uniref:hypothetical protein n=1 Tax=Adlercreutzia equolifaciens TaxID=446660 RepID=UPI0023AFD3A2|nr:hypothetical protein [Adlercreutzia equolifaciens]MDE8701732.1 hypothetical protein [Adlercreutzia equolifaciens]
MSDQQYDPAQSPDAAATGESFGGNYDSGYTQTADGHYAPGYGQPSGYQQQPYGYQDPYQAQQAYGYQQPGYQQAYQQPVAPVQAPPLYPMTDTDRNLRLVAFIFCILSLVGSCWLILPLAWMIPMCVISWGIYKGTKANTVAFDVCTLIFCSLVAGILLLCSNKDR